MNPVVFITLDGGQRSASIYSGQVAPVLVGVPGGVAVGSDVMIASGRGRLCQIVPHQSFLSLSGVQVNFYDSDSPISGGPIPTSGHDLVGSIAAGWGVSGQFTPAGYPININMPYQSGLCVNSRSGQPGFTVSWSPEPFGGVSG